MKKLYPFNFWLYIVSFLILQALNISPLQSQSIDPVSVPPTEYVFDNAGDVSKPPVRHLDGTTFGADARHILPGLTAGEKSLMEQSVDPPAVGVVRDLERPVIFSLSSIEIPEQGDIFVSGGRLSRINKDTVVWSTYFKSESAEELRVYFAEGNFPAGVQVNIFSDNDYAFTQPELSGVVSEYGFYTTTTFADHLFLEIVIPVNESTKELRFSITKVVHAYTRVSSDAPAVDCYEDVNCPYANGFGSIHMLRGSTAQLSFVVGGGYYICSGGLLNDIRAADWQPFLLTANHCFSTQASAASLEARFDMFSTSCNGPTNPGIILINGSNLLSTNSQSDFTMVLLKNSPGGTRWYLGWSAGSVANDVTMHSVNHPGGIPQKYQRMLNKTSPDFSCGGLPVANFHYTRALGGESVGGSSGGNVVDPSGYVLGQLYGWCYLSGATECNYPTFYNVWGKFEVSYANNNLQYWLYNGGSSVSMSTSPASSLSYGTVSPGNYYDQNVTVYNTGTVPNYLNLEAGSSYITGPDAGQYSIIGPAYLYLSPGTSGTITVRFAPTSAGPKHASLNIPHNANNIASPRVIALAGNTEPCLNILSMGDGGAANALTYYSSGTGVWYTSWNTPCGYQTPGIEQVYSFIAPYTGYYSIQVTSSNNMWVDYMWKETCDGGVWNCIDDIYSPTSAGAMYWTAGNTYHILADAESTSPTSQTFFVYYNPCLNTVPIAGTGSGNTQTYTGGGNGAWFTNEVNPCGWGTPGVETVYSFVAPYTGYYSIEVTSNAGYYVDFLWNTYCGPTGWNCIADIYYPGTYGSIYWTAGTTYYILLDDENTSAEPMSFYINPPEPCSGIIPIACNQPIVFNGTGEGVWDTYTCGYSCPGTEQIYSFVAPATGQYSIQVTAGGNWVDYMWSSTCGPTGWNCIADIYNPGQHGSMSWTAGETYYILLDDEDPTPGGHTFSVVCPELCHACPTYDFPIDPYESWQQSTSLHDINGCKIYRFYASSGLKYTFTTGCGGGATADYDTFLELYDGSCTWLVSDDDGCGYPFSKIEWTATTSGYHYLRVLGYGGAGGNYTLAYNLCYTAPSQPGSITGNTTVVEGIDEAFSIAEVYAATSYSWSYSGTGSISGNGTPGILLSATTDGVLSVTANNLCGISASSDLAITVIPQNLPVENVVITPGSSVCYAAGLTITVGGGGTYFYVLNGGSAEFVAGQNILFLPGVTVYNGGYLHGYITTSGEYCNLMVFKDGETGTVANNQNNLPGLNQDGSFFKVFPNPTSGKFTLELSSDPAGSMVRVQCYNLLGALILEKEFDSGRLHDFTLINQSPGLYMLKVTQNNVSGMQKIIRQQ